MENIEGEQPTTDESGSGGGQLLTRDAILNAEFTPKIQRVDVPEWGGYLFVKEMTGKQRDRFEASLLRSRGSSREDNMNNARATLVAASAVDANGKKIFNPDDVEKLGQKSAKALTRVFTVAQELSGLSQEDLEALTKSLGEDQNGASGSD